MATILPFRALCPNPSLVEKVASPPYDVLSSKEARDMARTNEQSYLHIIKPEIDLDETADPYSDRVYTQGAQNLKRFMNEHVLLQENESGYYLYQQKMGEHVQTGFVGIASVDEYETGIIRKHEHTRPYKVKDRVSLMATLNAQTGPVFMAYRQTQSMAELSSMLLQKSRKLYDFKSYFDVHHVFYKVDFAAHKDLIKEAFSNVPALYIADGHHRSESASVYCKQKRQQFPNYTGDEPFNYFLTVTFPDSDLLVLSYNRIVRDLNGQSLDTFLNRIGKNFLVRQLDKNFDGIKSPRTFGMYLAHRWYLLEIKEQFIPADAVKKLDVSILQDNLLFPILDIEDPRTNNRISFVGGIRGDQELEKLVDSGAHAVAFSLYPTSMQQIMDVADAGRVMPPKSTWFEPKLLSGLATHLLDEGIG